MKLDLAFAFHYMLFFSIAFLITPPKHMHLNKVIDEIKTDKKHPLSVSEGNAIEILHSDFLFKF